MHKHGYFNSSNDKKDPPVLPVPAFLHSGKSVFLHILGIFTWERPARWCLHACAWLDGGILLVRDLPLDEARHLGPEPLPALVPSPVMPPALVLLRISNRFTQRNFLRICEPVYKTGYVDMNRFRINVKFVNRVFLDVTIYFGHARRVTQFIQIGCSWKSLVPLSFVTHSCQCCTICPRTWPVPTSIGGHLFALSDGSMVVTSRSYLLRWGLITSCILLPRWPVGC